MKWIKNNLEGVLFRIVGLFLFVFGLKYLIANDVTAFAIMFGISFFCFFYANIARFKKFKGLGFEAEHWDDKQKEAEALIDRLKKINGIYSKEILLNKVVEGRWGTKKSWAENWKLYDEITEQHSELGQSISFSETKKTMDRYFLFDLIYPHYEKVRKAIWDGSSAARKVITEEFGSPIVDSTGYNKRTKELHSIKDKLENPFSFTKEGVLAETVITWYMTAKADLKDEFGVDIIVDDTIIENLQNYDKLEKQDILEITPELLLLADKL